MNFDTFFSLHAADALRIPVTMNDERRTELGNEGLFQLPLIALVILVLAKDRRKPKVSEIGQFVGETLEASMPGFRGASSRRAAPPKSSRSRAPRGSRRGGRGRGSGDGARARSAGAARPWARDR